jgi:hypothetical protein
MITLAKFSIEEVLPFAGPRVKCKLYSVKNVEYSIKMSSLRYQTFQKNINCVKCGLSGDFFLLQYCPFNEKKSKVKCLIENCDMCLLNLEETTHKLPEGWEKPHFNLYHMGKKGGLVLMTKDHIIPKSKKGPDKIENLQTLCCLCNLEKGNTVPNIIK